MRSKTLNLIEKVLNRFYPFIVGVDISTIDEDNYYLWLILKIDMSKFMEAYPDIEYSKTFLNGEDHTNVFFFAKTLEGRDQLYLLDVHIIDIINKVNDSLPETSSYDVGKILYSKIVLVS